MPTAPKPPAGMVGATHALPQPLATTTSLPALEQQSCDQKQSLPPVPPSGSSSGLTDVETAGETRAQNTDNYMSSDLLKVCVHGLVHASGDSSRIHVSHFHGNCGTSQWDKWYVYHIF